MLRHKIVLGSVICLLTAALVSQTLSQTGSGYRAIGGYKGGPSGSVPPVAMPKLPKTEMSDEDRHAALLGVAGATEEQWAVIKPKLEKVWQSRQTIGIRIIVFGARGGSQSGGKAAGGGGGGGGGGGFGSPGAAGSKGTPKSQDGIEVVWSWAPSWGRRPPQKPDEKVCADLFKLLKDKNAKTEEITKKADELTKIREQRTQELTQARKELRDILTLDQEARMVALGWLE